MARKPLFTTEELKNIIHAFFSEEKHKVMKLNFTNLAEFANDDLGIKNIADRHFSRNEEINDMVVEYQKTLDNGNMMYAGDNSKLATLDVKEFVKRNVGNAESLTFYLTNLQEFQRGLYEKTLQAELKIKKLEEEVEQLTKQKNDYYHKNRELSRQFDELKDKSMVYVEALNLQDEKQLLDALQSMKQLVVIDENEDRSVEKENLQKLDDSNGKDIEKMIDQYSDIFS